MANVSAYAEKLVLDFLLNGQTATRPTSRYLGLSYGTPNATSGSEISGPAAYTRAAYVAGAAASPAGTCIASGAVSFAAAAWASTIRGWQIWDTAATGAGNMLAWGTLSAATLPATASAFTFNSASIIVTCK